MFILCALNRDLRGLNPRAIELGLRLCDVGFGRGATLEAVLRQIQRLTVGIYGVVEQLLLCIRTPHLKIVDSDFGVQAQACSFKVGSARLSLFSRSRHRPPHAPPEVDLIGEIKWKGEISCAIVGLARWEKRQIGRIPHRRDARSSSDCGGFRRATESDRRAGLSKVCFGNLQALRSE